MVVVERGRKRYSWLLLLFLVVVETTAFGQPSGRVEFQPFGSQYQAIESQQIRPELEALRASYRQRLQQLDYELNQLGSESEVSPSAFRDVSRATEIRPILRSPSPPTEELGAEGFFGDRLQVTIGSGGTMKLYGYGRGDLVYADSQLSNTVVPFFAVSEDPANTVGPNSVPVQGNDDQFNVNIRLTRLGLDFQIYDRHVSAVLT